MILLDTNVISELMRPRPLAAVVEWVNGQETSVLWLSTVTVAEIGLGLRILPVGKRRQVLTDRFDVLMNRGFEHRLLGFDQAAARIYPEIIGNRRELGRPMSYPDGQIAAIARAHGLDLATRNVSDFEECGIRISNPFQAS